MQENEREIREIKHSMERLENHFKVYKDDMISVQDSIKDLRNAIVGNQVNGNKGFIHLLDKISEKVELIEAENILLKEHMKTIKFISGSFLVAAIGFIFWLFEKK